MLTIFTGSTVEPIELGFFGIIFLTVAVLSVYVALYVFRTIGLYKLAKRKNLKGKFWAFIPFAWIYVAILLVGETKMFGKNLKNLAWIFTLVVVISGLIDLAYQFIIYYPIVGNILLNEDVMIRVAVGGDAVQGWDLYNYPTMVPIYWQNYGDPYLFISHKIDMALNVLSRLATIFIAVTVFINLFKKYWPQKMALATILSVLVGLFPIFVFVIRNKKEINYQEYLRSRFQSQRNPYGAYGQGNPYSQNPYQQYTQRQQDVNPFEDFGGHKNDDPFEEFSNKTDKKD